MRQVVMRRVVMRMRMKGGKQGIINIISLAMWHHHIMYLLRQNQRRSKRLVHFTLG